MGFKYFGILRGVGFVLSGASQLEIVALVRAVQGSCHVTIGNMSCTHGYWTELHLLFAILLIVLIGVPVMDYYHNTKGKESKIESAQLPNRSLDKPKQYLNWDL